MQKRLRDIDLFKVYKNWYNGCGVFECYVHSTPFVTLKNYPDFILSYVSFDQDEGIQKNIQIISKYMDQKTVFMIDVEAPLALRTAYAVQKELSVKPVLTFRQIHHPYGFVFDDFDISCLLSVGEKITNIHENGYLFLLDKKRYGNFSDDEYKSRFNNQYELTEFDLPVPEMFTDFGFNRVIFLYKGSVMEDVAPYLDYLEENGIQVMKTSI